MKKIGTMPAGSYYVADPRYVLRDKNYEKLPRNVESYEENFNGYKIIGMLAKGGSGGYSCSRQERELNDVATDSGMIAIIPADIIEEDPPSDMVNVVTFNQEFTCWYDGEEGILYFGNVLVYT